MAAETVTAAHGQHTPYRPGGGAGDRQTCAHRMCAHVNIVCARTNYLCDAMCPLSHLIGMFSGEVRIHPSQITRVLPFSLKLQ